MNDERRPYYVSLSVAQEDRVRAVRDRVWNAVNPGDAYEKVEPHVTVHPGFTCDHRTAARVAGVLAYVVGDAARVNGVSFWPGPDEPMVAKLDLDLDLEAYRDTIEEYVVECGGTIDRSPVPPHLTLFKSGDAGEDADTSVGSSGRFLTDLEGQHGDWYAEVSGYTVKQRI